MTDATTHRVTKADVLRAAKKAYGKTATIRECGWALTPQQRAAETTKHEERKSRMAAIEAELAANRIDHLGELTKAARFAVDVDGDPPSIDQLREALELHERIVALVHERYQLRQEMMHKASLELSRRYEVTITNGMFTTVPVGANSYAELLDKLESRQLAEE